MKFHVSFASALFLALLLLLVLARPDGANSHGARRNAAPTIKTIYPTFTTIDVPGAGLTEATAINLEGDIVGIYGTSSYDEHQRGFLLENGKLMHVDYPHAYTTLAFGINDAGIVVGAAGLKDRTAYVGYTYDGITFKNIRDGSDSATFAYSMNNARSIVGGAGTIYGTQGFLETGGTFTVINFPGQNSYEYATNINNKGEIVGLTAPDENAYSYINGQFHNLDVPGAIETEAFGINDHSVVAGWYKVMEGCSCAFAEKNGNYLSFSYPGAQSTIAFGINASGQIVGGYYNTASVGLTM